MKNTILFVLLVFLATPLFSQTEPIMFTKIVENRDKIRFGGKDALDWFFFGNSTSDVEFVVSPSFSGAYGFRITIDTLAKKCMLETKRVLNKKSVDSLLHAKYPVPMTTIKRGEPLPTYSKEEREERSRQTRVALSLQENERWKLYDLESLKLPVSCAFANKLYDMVVSAIENFRSEGRITDIPIDGERIVFRVPVNYELWTLRIQSPWKGETKRLTGIFTQMIDDAVAGVFDESKYIALLNNM